MTREARQPEALSPEGEHLFAALNNDEDPLSCALIGGAALEQVLMSLLLKHFIVVDTSEKLFKAGGALGDFFRCAQLAYCLGLLPKKAFQNLLQIGEIRNRFAHSPVPLTFADEEIAELCAAMHLPKHMSVGDLPPESLKTDPKFRFTSVVAWLWNQLLLKALPLAHPERNKEVW